VQPALDLTRDLQVIGGRIPPPLGAE